MTTSAISAPPRPLVILEQALAAIQAGDVDVATFVEHNYVTPHSLHRLLWALIQGNPGFEQQLREAAATRLKELVAVPTS